MKKELRVFAPASVANLACGFDIFGLALENPGDEITVRFRAEKGLRIQAIHGDGGALSLDPQKNTAGVSVLKMLEGLKSHQGFEIEIHKKMPLGSGLGSSAASAAGSLFAANALLGSPFSKKELIPFAMEAERVACGTAHADNVAPSLLGGFVLIRSYDPIDIVSIPVRLDLYCSILHPKIEVPTQLAREILSKQIPLQNLVRQTGNAAGLVTALLLGDAGLLSRSLEDWIIEPMRSSLIPHFHEIKAAALEAGALGGGISGSGPSIFALSQNLEDAHRVGTAMHKLSQAKALASDLYISPINQKGPRIL